MQLIKKANKKCYVSPLLEIIEWEGVSAVCQSGNVNINPGFDDEIIITVDEFMEIDKIDIIL